MPRDAAWLTDIATGSRRIARFIRGMDRDAFLNDDEKQSAVFGQLVIIGEAANRLAREFHTAHPSIPWSRIIGMRNRIVHGYDEIDWDIVWQAATVELPGLLQEIEKLIPNNDG